MSCPSIANSRKIRPDSEPGYSGELIEAPIGRYPSGSVSYGPQTEWTGVPEGGLGHV